MNNTPKFAPFERLVIDNPDLDGSRGFNRAPPRPGKPIANTDIDAVTEFLQAHRATPTTQRNYTKEVERLMLWCIFVKNIPISSMDYKDAQEYMDFLANPEPVEFWVSTKKFPRESDEWRPFVLKKKPPKKKGDPPSYEAGLSPASRLTTMASLGAFFTWLNEYGYTIKNPFHQIKALRKQLRGDGKITSNMKVERFLDEEMWAAFIEAIEMMPKETQAQQDQYERALFLSSMMLFLAPRASEIVNGRMRDFILRGKHWWWQTTGKGSKFAEIPVNDEMLEALIRYRTYLGKTPLPLTNDTAPLLTSVRNGEAITTRHLNDILYALFEVAAKILKVKANDFADTLTKAEWLNRADKILQASAHWGRHTSITFQVRSGVPLNYVCLNARHADMKTTGLYVHEDLDHWHQQSQKLHK